MVPPTTDGDGSSSAASKVFNTTELLENILLFLDLRTLLLSKGVNTQFRDVVDGSTKIQKALFFEPLSYPTTADVELLETQPTEPKHPWGGKGEPYLPDHIAKVQPVNPLLDRYLGYGCGWGSEGWTTAPTMSAACDDATLERLEKSDPCSSWRRMLVLQPHAAPFYVFDTISNSDQIVRVSGFKGLRMEDFIAHGRLSNDDWHGTVQLNGGMLWSLGKYDQDSVREWCRAETLDRICGWEVLSPGFGDGLKEHPQSLW